MPREVGVFEQICPETARLQAPRERVTATGKSSSRGRADRASGGDVNFSVIPWRTAMPARIGRILVVDDDPAIRAILTRALAEEGYDVVAMNDGQAGLDAVTTADTPFDLVVTNNCMPRLSGAEMVTQLRRQFPDLPILHLDDSSRPVRFPLPGDVPNLPKPFTLDRFLAEVGRLLANKHES